MVIVENSSNNSGLTKLNHVFSQTKSRSQLDQMNFQVSVRRLVNSALKANHAHGDYLTVVMLIYVFILFH